VIVAIDYDQTYTLDPPAWDAVVETLRSAGHVVYCVTCRRDTAENRAEVDAGDMAVWFTGLAPKKWYMEKRGIKVDVWVDDDPRCVTEGK
jgi:hypothetical protein